MNYLKIGLIALATTLLFTSCNNGDGENTGGSELPEDSAYIGTFIVAPGTPIEFTLQDARVELSVFNNGDSARIDMLQVKFAEAMPMKMDIAVPGVKLTKKNETYSISGDTIVPFIVSGPFPSRTITELSGTATNETLEFSMVCGSDPLSFTGTRKEE